MARRRDYRKIAENAALLGAQAAGFSVPIGPAMGLWQAVRGEGVAGADKAFVARLLDQIDRWCQQHADDVALVGGMPSLWREGLLDRLDAEPLGSGPEAARALAEGIFSTPLTAEGVGHLDTVGALLVANMPELIVQAGDPNGVFGALRAVFAGDLANLEAKIAARLDRLCPDPPREIAVALVAGYLARLVARLDRDTWSARERDDNSDLVSRTSVQQPLTVRLEKNPTKVVPVGELAASCERLVILGGPGAGKTWAARSVAVQAAEVALGRLAAGVGLEDLELPLFAGCTDVLKRGVSSGWDQAVKASLNWADDGTPGDRPILTQALCGHPRLLLILDGLDETTDLDDGALHSLTSPRSAGASRLVLTGRHGSWNSGLLRIEPRNNGHQVGDLQPFSHDDVLRAVEAWLHDDPSSRDRLLARLSDPGSSLSRQARVPLLCAMLCLAARPSPASVDGDDAADLFQPGRQVELYDFVIDRLLRAAWRGTTPPRPAGHHVDDVVSEATEWLEGLADDGNVDDVTTGLSNWPGTVQPTRSLPAGAALYVDNVAPPVRRPALVGRRSRRFVHRRLQEHLAARALCRQPAAEVAGQLLSHLWFDPTWAEVIPTVIAAHPQGDQLVTHLGRAVTKAIPCDPLYGLEEALVKASTLTERRGHGAGERDVAIERALRSMLERTDPRNWGKLAGAAHWPAIDAARERLLERLTEAQLDSGEAGQVAEALVSLGPTNLQAERGAQRVLDLLAMPDLGLLPASALTRALAGLAHALPQRYGLPARVLDLLAAADLGRTTARMLTETLAELTRAAPDRDELVERVFHLIDTADLEPMTLCFLAEEFAPLVNDKRRLGDALSNHIAAWNLRDVGHVARTIRSLKLKMTWSSLLFGDLLDEDSSDCEYWPEIAECLALLVSTPEENSKVIDFVVERIESAVDSWRIGLAAQEVVPLLNLSPADTERIRTALVGRIERERELGDSLLLAQSLDHIDLMPADKVRARTALFGRLSGQLDDLWEAREGDTWLGSSRDLGAALGCTLAALDATPQECGRLRAALLDRLASEGNADVVEELIAALVRLPAGATERMNARTGIRERLMQTTDETLVPALIFGLRHLDPTKADLTCLRSELLKQLKRDDSDWFRLEASSELEEVDLTEDERGGVHPVV